MFWGVCISNVTSVRDVYLSSFKLFCIFWCLLCKTLDYMKLFKNQIQVYQNTKNYDLKYAKCEGEEAPTSVRIFEPSSVIEELHPRGRFFSFAFGILEVVGMRFDES